jgi:hypothetical protein
MSEKHGERIEQRTNNETLTEAARESLEKLRKPNATTKAKLRLLPRRLE